MSIATFAIASPEGSACPSVCALNSAPFVGKAAVAKRKIAVLLAVIATK